jgi:hypothetical protein
MIDIVEQDIRLGTGIEQDDLLGPFYQTRKTPVGFCPLLMEVIVI